MTEMFDVFFRGEERQYFACESENLDKIIQGATIYRFGLPLDEDGLPEASVVNGRLIKDLKGATIGA